MALQGAERRLKTEELAAQLGTTAEYLRRVAMPLTARGWITSEPGPAGGYRCGTNLDEVSLLDLVDATEGGVDRERCVLDDGSCNGADPCPLHAGWSAARDELQRILAATPLPAMAMRQAVAKPAGLRTVTGEDG